MRYQAHGEKSHSEGNTHAKQFLEFIKPHSRMQICTHVHTQPRMGTVIADPLTKGTASMRMVLPEAAESPDIQTVNDIPTLVPEVQLVYEHTQFLIL